MRRRLGEPTDSAMLSKSALKWTAYIAGGAMAAGFILPFVSYYGGTDEDGNDWQRTRGINPIVNLARENARNSFPVFVDALEIAGARVSGFEVEVELRAPNGIPTAVWLDDIRISPDDMMGTLTVTPPNGLRDGSTKGDKVNFNRIQVLDWRYPEDGRWRGDFVLRVSLAEYSEEDRLKISQYLHDKPLP